MAANPGRAPAPTSASPSAPGISAMSLWTRTTPTPCSSPTSPCSAPPMAARPSAFSKARRAATIITSCGSTSVPDGTVGVATTILVQARDAYGNPRSTGGDGVTVSITGANPGTPTMTDDKDGLYTVLYTP